MKTIIGGIMQNQQTCMEMEFESIKMQIQKNLDRDKILGILEGDLKNLGPDSIVCTIYAKNSPQSEFDLTIRAMKSGEDSPQVICYNLSKIPPTPSQCSGWLWYSEEGGHGLSNFRVNNERLTPELLADLVWIFFKDLSGINYS